MWLLDTLRELCRKGTFVTFTTRFSYTGFFKERDLIFARPVSKEFPYAALYGDWGPWWSKHINAAGQWVIGQKDGMGQHKGLDFKVPEGTEIRAMCDGIVALAGWENINNPKQGFGQRVRHQITTSDGKVMTLVYGHMSKLEVRGGQQIHAGDKLGLSGHTGHVTGPHLHIELVDPQGQYHPISFGPDDPPPIKSGAILSA